ncbi:MAG: PD-(D/E)XK nuclease family protein [Methanobacteriota archaeon]
MPQQATLLYAVPGLGFQELLDRFTASLSENPLTSWLILPTDALVQQARDQLLRQHYPIIPDRICTPGDLCLFMLSESEDGITFISDSDARILLSRVIVQHNKELSLFMKDRSPSGRTLSDLQRLFSYIIRNELTFPDCLGNLQTQKSDQIGTIFSAFRSKLKQLSRVNTDTLIQWAITSLEEKSAGEMIHRFTHLFWLGQYSSAPLDMRLIQGFARKTSHMVYVSPHGADQTIFTGDASWVFTDRKYNLEKNPGSPLDQVKTLLFSDTCTDKQVSIMRDMISLKEWKDPISELSGIARQILLLRKQDIPLEDVAVVFPDPDLASGYIADVFDDYHIPYKNDRPETLFASPLISFYSLLGECVEKGFRYEELIRLIRSPYLRYQWEPLSDNPDAPGYLGKNLCLLNYEFLDLICRSYGITGGYIDWEARFEQIAGYISPGNDTTPEEAENGCKPSVYIPERPLPGDTILLTMEGTLSLIHLLRNLQARGLVTDHCQSFRSILKSIGSPVPGCTETVFGDGIMILDTEQRALQAFDTLLADLEQQPGNENDVISFPEFLSRVKLLLMDRRMKEESREGVFVTGLSDIEHIQVPYLFLASLNEGLIPKLNYRLPFINGSEAGKIGDDLHSYIKKERYRFIAALLAGRKQIYLSSFEHRDERVVLRSSFLEPFHQAGSFPSWGEEASIPDPEECSDSASAYYSGVMMVQSRWEKALAFLPDHERVSDVVIRIGIERNFRFRLNRSVYDGIIGEDPGIRNEMEERFGPEYVWSTSLIETYAQCPYRFYLERILRIKPLPMLGSELSPDAKGRLIHSVVCRFKRRIQEKNGFPLRQEKFHDAVSAILEIAIEELDAISFDTPVWMAKRRQLVGGERYGAGIFEKYVAAEIARLAPDEEGNEPLNFIPRHFEFSFGAVPDQDDDPASASEPINLAPIATRRLDANPDLLWSAEDIPKELLLCGKIDRIDITESGDFGVVDYKTGIKIPSTTEISAAKALQLPLYLMAFAEITGNNPVYGSYCHLHRSVTHSLSLYNPAYKSSLPWGKMPRSEPKWEEIMDNALFQTCSHIMHIHQGVFPIHADRGCSPDWFCPYKTICRFQPDRGSHLGELIRYPDEAENTGGTSMKGGDV